MLQGAFLTLLSDRLNDASNVYWSRTELTLYLQEALSTFQAYTGWYRKHTSLSVSNNNPWIYLPNATPSDVFAYNVTDRAIASVMLYHLLEPQLSGSSWVGTDQFDIAKIQGALQNRCDRFLGDTGMVVTLLLQTGGTIALSTVNLVPSIIDIRRVAWVDTAGPNSGIYSTLWKSNEWEINSFLPNYVGTGSGEPTGDPPQVYSVSVTTPNLMQLAPVPTQLGNLEMCVVQTGPTLNITGAGVNVNIPDDFTWAVKFGAMADLLSGDGQAKDLERAAYCEQRYQEGVELAKTFPSLLGLQLNGNPLWVGSVFDLDAYSPGWEISANWPFGGPQIGGMAGRTLLATYPAVTNEAQSLTADLVSNAPYPFNDSSYIQIPSDVIASLLDYTQHLASFKMGGQEFTATIPLKNNLLMEAANYNGRLRQMDFYNDALRGQALLQQAEGPRLNAAPIVAYNLTQQAQQGPGQGSQNG